MTVSLRDLLEAPDSGGLQEYKSGAIGRIMAGVRSESDRQTILALARQAGGDFKRLAEKWVAERTPRCGS
jgi:hypothetical protein